MTNPFRTHPVASLLALWLALVPANVAAAEAGPIDFESDAWEIQRGAVTEYLGRKCLQGRATLKDVEFENGVIEVDMAFEGARAFVGILFRETSAQDREHIYLRPHKSGLPDALQYTPVFNGMSGWQLYNGEGFTAAAVLPHGEWIHVRLEVSGVQARLFLGDAPQPALVVTDLKRGRTKGAIGVEASVGPGCFADFRYEARDNLEFPDPPEIAEAVGMLTDWQISRPFKWQHVDYERHPSAQELTDLGWRPITAEPSGLHNISRFVAKDGSEPNVIFARTTIRAEKEEVREINFGYSDAVVLFLNGQRVFTGLSTFRTRDASFLGAAGLFDTVYLPLKKGDNELMLALIETFGGWGFLVQDGSWLLQDPGLKELWELRGGLNLPESAVYDARRDVIYVSSFGQYSPPGGQFVSKVRPDGTVESLEWVTGLVLPLGVALHGDRLYVVERNALAEIEPDHGTILNRHPFPEPAFPNDVAGDEDGNLYISDSGKGVIYRHSGGETEVWLSGDQVSQPNGLVVHGDALVWGNNGDGKLKAAELASGEIRTVADMGPGIIDGLQVDEDGNYLVTHSRGVLYRVQPSGKIEVLLDLSARGTRLADLAYVPGKRMLIIPTLTGNKLLAYGLAD